MARIGTIEVDGSKVNVIECNEDKLWLWFGDLRRAAVKLGFKSAPSRDRVAMRSGHDVTDMFKTYRTLTGQLSDEFAAHGTFMDAQYLPDLFTVVGLPQSKVAAQCDAYLDALRDGLIWKPVSARGDAKAPRERLYASKVHERMDRLERQLASVEIKLDALLKTWGVDVAQI